METYLIHHGILGQRWGIRRYQNKDGSLTPKGKKRLEKIEKKIDADYEKYKRGEKIAGKLLKTKKKVPFTVDEQLDIAKRLGVSDKDIDKLRKIANRLQTNNHLQNQLRGIQMQHQTQHHLQIVAQQQQEEQIQRQNNLIFQQQANLAMQQHMQSVMQQQMINHQFMYM